MMNYIEMYIIGVKSKDVTKVKTNNIEWSEIKN